MENTKKEVKNIKFDLDELKTISRCFNGRYAYTRNISNSEDLESDLRKVLISNNKILIKEYIRLCVFCLPQSTLDKIIFGTKDKNVIALYLLLKGDINLINQIFGNIDDFYSYCYACKEEIGFKDKDIIKIKKLADTNKYNYVDSNIEDYLKTINNSKKSL